MTFGAPCAGEIELAEAVVDALPRPRAGALRLLRHRGDDERHPAGARRHRPRPDRQVRRLLPRPRRPPAGLRRLGAGDLRAAELRGRPGAVRRPHPRPAARRRGGARRALRRRGRPHRRGDRRAGAGQQRPAAAAPRVPAPPARPDRARRRPAHLRRGHQRLPGGARRRRRALRDHARPRHLRQDHRRRHAGGRLRRAARSHAASRARGRRLPGRHALRQSGGDGGRHRDARHPRARGGLVAARGARRGISKLRSRPCSPPPPSRCSWCGRARSSG